MPKKLTETEGEGKVLHDVSTNGIDEEDLNDFIRRYEAEEAAVAEVMKTASVSCQPNRDEMKAIKKEAAEEGMEKKAFMAIIRKRRFLRKAQKVADALAERQRAVFDEMDTKSLQLDLFAAPPGETDTIN